MIDALRRALEREPSVAYALVFGSAARGTEHPASDADIAVELIAGARRDVQALGGLAARLESAAGRAVDLVLLDEAPPPLAYRVFRDGELLIERDHAALGGAQGARDSRRSRLQARRRAVCGGRPARRRSSWSIARFSPRRWPPSGTPPRACALSCRIPPPRAPRIGPCAKSSRSTCSWRSRRVSIWPHTADLDAFCATLAKRATQTDQSAR